MKINLKKFKDLNQKGIYRIYNTITSKNYIGSTWKSFKSRWKQHLSKLDNNKHHSHEMQNAFNKYGTDSFVCEILEIVDDRNKLLDREAYYIDKYDSYRNGYNENPTPSNSPMLNESSCKKSSETHKKLWESIKNSMTEEEFEKYKQNYAEIRGKFKGCSPWNKGKKMTEKQTKNMKKPKIHGVSQAMKDVHTKNAQLIKDRADYIIVMILIING